MKGKQMVFDGVGGLEEPQGLTRKDLDLMKVMKARRIACPYCLHVSQAWDFRVLLKNPRKGHLVSRSRYRCPRCGNRYTRNTVAATNRMSPEEYSQWFWSGVFSKFSTYERIPWDLLKQQLRRHFSRKFRGTFWRVYWEYKAQSQGGREAEDDEKAYRNYVETYRKEAKADWRQRG